MPVRPRTALLATVVATLGVVAVWALAFRSSLGRAVDAAVLEGFMGLRRDRTEPLADWLAGLADPLPFAVLSALLIAVALVRGRVGTAVAAGVVLLMANVTTQVLKEVTAAPRPAAFDMEVVGAASWPSGHTTAAMTVALCLVLVSPARLRPLAAAVGGLYVVGVVYAILVLDWHFPSDVAGGLLVATAWTLAAVTVLAAFARRPADAPPVRRRLPRAAAPAALAAAALGAAGVGVALVRPEWAVSYVQDNTVFVLGAALIAATALALAAALAALLSR